MNQNFHISFNEGHLPSPQLKPYPGAEGGGLGVVSEPETGTSASLNLALRLPHLPHHIPVPLVLIFLPFLARPSSPVYSAVSSCFNVGEREGVRERTTHAFHLDSTLHLS